MNFTITAETHSSPANCPHDTTLSSVQRQTININGSPTNWTSCGFREYQRMNGWRPRRVDNNKHNKTYAQLKAAVHRLRGTGWPHRFTESETTLRETFRELIHEQSMNQRSMGIINPPDDQLIHWPSFEKDSWIGSDWWKLRDYQGH